jgi:hypothetical protein
VRAWNFSEPHDPQGHKVVPILLGILRIERFEGFRSKFYQSLDVWVCVLTSHDFCFSVSFDHLEYLEYIYIFFLSLQHGQDGHQHGQLGQDGQDSHIGARVILVGHLAPAETTTRHLQVFGNRSFVIVLRGKVFSGRSLLFPHVQK